ncbi:hypothetical protein DAEQUDRAFT_159431 [Daedalea quercina L-15889]|uniref:Uncharacterized protein n=1 Tax=Daedalea quercina L-15889 TaxID=1314783 RepID=A0A165KKY6_9APHY|nr:hypothetical protein DAEQUDRAFT_159431 [Daedalea quercina L-15889]
MGTRLTQSQFRPARPPSRLAGRPRSGDVPLLDSSKESDSGHSWRARKGSAVVSCSVAIAPPATHRRCDATHPRPREIAFPDRVSAPDRWRSPAARHRRCTPVVCSMSATAAIRHRPAPQLPRRISASASPTLSPWIPGAQARLPNAHQHTSTLCRTLPVTLFAPAINPRPRLIAGHPSLQCSSPMDGTHARRSPLSTRTGPPHRVSQPVSPGRACTVPSPLHSMRRDSCGTKANTRIRPARMTSRPPTRTVAKSPTTSLRLPCQTEPPSMRAFFACPLFVLFASCGVRQNGFQIPSIVRGQWEALPERLAVACGAPLGSAGACPTMSHFIYQYWCGSPAQGQGSKPHSGAPPPGTRAASTSFAESSGPRLRPAQVVQPHPSPHRLDR